jgi:hypothetical protein
MRKLVIAMAVTAFAFGAANTVADAGGCKAVKNGQKNCGPVQPPPPLPPLCKIFSNRCPL